MSRIKTFLVSKSWQTLLFLVDQFRPEIEKKIVDICAARFSQHRFSMCAESAYIGDDEEKRENKEKEEEEEQ